MGRITDSSVIITCGKLVRYGSTDRICRPRLLDFSGAKYYLELVFAAQRLASGVVRAGSINNARRAQESNRSEYQRDHFRRRDKGEENRGITAAVSQWL